MLKRIARTKDNKTFYSFLPTVMFFITSVQLVHSDVKQSDLIDDWSMLKTGKDIYYVACVACHGTRGQGSDPTMLGFDPGPPDFTDCKFTSREMTSDWIGIATHGGPLKGFSAMMPAFGKALSEKQIDSVVTYIKNFCPESKWPPGEFNLPKALNTGKAFPEDEIAWSVSADLDDYVSVKGKFVIARRVAARHQIEAVIPLEVHRLEPATEGDDESRWGKGAGDIAAAWKSVLWFSRSAGSIGSITFDLFFPTGNRKDGIGSGTVLFEPALAIAQIVPRIGFLQLQGGVELSADTALKNHVVFWRGAFGQTFKRGGVGRSFSPMIEVLGERELSEENSSTEWSLVPEFQLALSRRHHVRLGTGMAIPITDFDTRPINFMAYLVWDWYDGGFTEGWQ